MTEEKKKTNRYKGGLARAEKLSPEERSNIAKKAAKSRWKNGETPEAEYRGELKIGDSIFPCAVLSDGTRVLTQSDFMAGMDMYYSGWISQEKLKDEATADTPHFLAFKSLKPFVERHLGSLQSIVLKYKTESGTIAHGIKAEIIPKICEVWLDAADEIKLGVRQKKIAKKSKMMIRALAHVGIIALVDEATGYKKKKQDEYRKIFDAFISDEIRDYKKEFEPEFFEMLYKLYGLEKKNKKHPSFFGHFIRRYIYHPLANSNGAILDNLDEKNNVIYDINGNRKGRKYKMFQFLSEKVGLPAFKAHLWKLTGIGFASKNKAEFDKLFTRVFPSIGDQYDWLETYKEDD